MDRSIGVTDPYRRARVGVLGRGDGGIMGEGRG
jgi:hypothetical protein